LSARERREIHLAAEKEVEKELAQGLLKTVSAKVVLMPHFFTQVLLSEHLRNPVLTFLRRRVQSRAAKLLGRARGRAREVMMMAMVWVVATSLVTRQGRGLAMWRPSNCRSVGLYFVLAGYWQHYKT
jgi:hypothetical protein